MEHTTLEQIIRQHITLTKRPNGNGWWGVLCKVCNDHGKKGKRAGFRFDGDITAYNCFNCGHAAVYDPNEHNSFSKDMSTVLDAFGISKHDANAVIHSYMKLDGSTGTKRVQPTIITPKAIDLPPYFIPLNSESSDEIHQYACEYLKYERGVDWKGYPFYIGTKTSNPASVKWHARLIIPIYRNKDVIFYTGRDLTGIRTKKYLNPDIPRDTIMYGFDVVEDTASDDPIYIVEGWFDAHVINGVAVFGNKLTTAQLAWLNKNPRQKVVIPDRFGDGYLLAEQAIKMGWSVSTPDIGDCKDINDAVVKYGLDYTLITINEHTYAGVQAAVRINMYCTAGTKERRNVYVE